MVSVSANEKVWLMTLAPAVEVMPRIPACLCGERQRWDGGAGRRAGQHGCRAWQVRHWKMSSAMLMNQSRP